METRESTQDLETLLISFLNDFNKHAGHLEYLGRFADWNAQYLRAMHLMVKACLADAPPNSEAESNLQALSFYLSDVESWSLTQGVAVRELYNWLAVPNPNETGAAVCETFRQYAATAGAQAAPVVPAFEPMTAEE